jgi:hypothetical protein
MEELTHRLWKGIDEQRWQRLVVNMQLESLACTFSADEDNLRGMNRNSMS